VSPEFRRIVYRIESGNVGDEFTVNSSTGQIGVSTPLDYESSSWPTGWNGSVTLTLVAMDSQLPSLYDTTSVVVHVRVSHATP